MALRISVVAIALAFAANASGQFKSGVDAVYLDVTVQAPDGSIVRGLTKDDFQIFDEGVQHDVAVFSDEPAPISVGVLIDTSGSMTGERIAAAIRAAGALGRSLQARDLWSISTFDFFRRTLIGWRPYNAAIIESLKAMPTGGTTELFKAVADMVPFMQDTPHRKRAMLVITDGIDNSVMAALMRQQVRPGPGGTLPDVGLTEPAVKAQQALQSGEVLLYALGINVASRAGAVHLPSLQRLAEPTGGAAIVASSLREVETEAQRIADELRQQYTLGFYPKKAADGTYRRVTVTTRNMSYRVRTRAGYLASRPR
jgi:Ca-activated chloride channel homolog